MAVWGGGGDSSSSSGSSNSGLLAGGVCPRSVWCRLPLPLYHTEGCQVGDIIETILRGSAVVEVDRGGRGGGAVRALLADQLRGCYVELVAGHGTSGGGPVTASSTINEMFIFLL